MGALRKLVTGFSTHDEELDWEARLEMLREQLEGVPIGIFLDAYEVGLGSSLDMSVLSGQGEHHESTFLFYLD